jgi:transposase
MRIWPQPSVGLIDISTSTISERNGQLTERLDEEPRTGALFVFSNRRHTRIKILYWDETGL